MDRRRKRDRESYDDDDGEGFKAREHPRSRGSLFDRITPSTEHSNHPTSHPQNPLVSFRSRNQGGLISPSNAESPGSVDLGRIGRHRVYRLVPPGPANAEHISRHNVELPGSTGTGSPRSHDTGSHHSSYLGRIGSHIVERLPIRSVGPSHLSNTEHPGSSNTRPAFSSSLGAPHSFDAGHPLSSSSEPGRPSIERYIGRHRVGSPQPSRAGQSRSESENQSGPPQIQQTNTGGSGHRRRSRSPERRSSRPYYRERSGSRYSGPNRTRSRERGRSDFWEPAESRSRYRERYRPRFRERGQSDHWEPSVSRSPDSSQNSVNSRHCRPAAPRSQAPAAPHTQTPLEPRQTPVEPHPQTPVEPHPQTPVEPGPQTPAESRSQTTGSPIHEVLDPYDTPVERKSPKYLNSNPVVVQDDNPAVLQEPKKESSAACTEVVEPQRDTVDMPSKVKKESGSKDDAEHKGLGKGFKSTFKLIKEESHTKGVGQPEVFESDSKSDIKSLVSGTITVHPEEIQDAIRRAHHFVSATAAICCRVCNQKILTTLDPVELYQSWHKEKTLNMMSSVICSGAFCTAPVCMGCGEKPRVDDPLNSSKLRGETIGWCCPKGRVFAIWVMLCRYDLLELGFQQSESRPASVIQDRASQNTGTGYAKMTALAYMGPGRYSLSRPLDFKQMEDRTDNLTEEIIRLMIALLPKPGTKAKQEAIAIASMLELSLLQDRLGQLLRNDTLRDVTKRRTLYFEAFELVKRLAEHERFDYLVTDDRFIKKRSAGLFEITNPSEKKSTSQSPIVIGDESEGKNSSLVSCMSNLERQSSKFLDLKTAKERADIAEMAELIVKRQKALPQRKASQPQVATWKEYHKKNCLVSKQGLFQQLRFDSRNLALMIHHSPKTRLGRITTEIAELVTSLPEGIFVIVDEARIDVMKVLIVGPTETPYEGGLFEFDVVLPEHYALEPPSVKFLTTNNGSIAFNPNLYADGKVCLSLIGTFPGDAASKWQSGKSTILSVLVSIQGMIFCEHPYENEPGFEGAHLARNPQMRAKEHRYNLKLQTYTMRYAILDWMSKDSMRNGIWHDVVNKYFFFNGKALLQKAKIWEASNEFFRFFNCANGNPDDYQRVHGERMTLLQEMKYFVGDEQ